MQLPPEVLDTIAPFDEELIDAAIAGDEAPLEDDDIAEILGWTPPDIEYADWAGRKWVACTEERSEIDRIAETQIARIKAWQDAEHARLDRKLGWLAGTLERFAIARRVATKAATTKLPSVTISTRETRAGVEVVDEAAAIAWAEGRPWSAEVVKVSKRLLKSKLPKEMTEVVAPVENEDGVMVARLIDTTTGEPIPGLMPREAGLSVSISAAGL